MKVKVKVTQSCLTLCNPLDNTVQGILQARILEWVVVPFSRGTFQPRDWTQVFCIAGGFFTSWATREALIIQNNSSQVNGSFLFVNLENKKTLFVQIWRRCWRSKLALDIWFTFQLGTWQPFWALPDDGSCYFSLRTSPTWTLKALCAWNKPCLYSRDLI